MLSRFITPSVDRRRLPAVALLLGLAAIPACSTGERELGPLPTANTYSSLAYLEPTGMTILSSSDWAGFSLTSPSLGGNLSNWYRYASGNTGKVVVDATAGCGSTSTLDVTINQGAPQGGGPEHLMVGTNSNWLTQKGSYKQLYLRYCVWVPANYYGSSSGVQKLFHIWGVSDLSAGGSTQAVPAVFGVGTSGLSHQLRLQNMSTLNGGKISFNLHCGGAQRGRWDRVEILLTENTGGTANGKAQMWLNGTSCMSVANLTWSGGGRTVKRWTAVQLNPTYGGSGSVPTTQHVRYGAVRVSAK